MASPMENSGVNVKEMKKLFQPYVHTDQQPENPASPMPKPKVAKPVQECRSKMNDSKLFEEPHRLVFTDENTKQLSCDENTLKLLSQVDMPMNVVAITGLFRTGKSYLLNRLAGVKTGFKIGSDIHACTKGIWIWCRHHPVQEDQTLVLLDVEGFGDPDNEHRHGDTWLFTLATVLSSTLVYNNKGAFDRHALDRLKFLEEVDSTIQVSQNEEDKKLFDLDFFFPNFVVTLRDLNLAIVNKAKESIIPDEYLENLLEQKRGEGKHIETYNKIRLLIRRYFKQRKCFIFKQPCGSELEKLPDKAIGSDFLRSVKEFSEYIFRLKPMQLKSGRRINGRMFANLASDFVTSIGNETPPCILTATRHMVEMENKEAVDAASNIYKKKMQEYIAELGEINPSDTALVESHEQCIGAAQDYFKKVVVFDDEEVFKRQAMGECKRLLSNFKRICDENSANTCRQALAKLNNRIEKKLKSGAYSCQSGYDEYINDINWVVRTYKGLAGLGPKARVIMQDYLDGKEAEEEFVYKLVIKATDTGEGNKMELPREQRPPSMINDISSNFARSTSFSHSLKEENIEDKMKQELEAQCDENKKKIQENYIENLEMKIQELERQKLEAPGNTTILTEIGSRITYFEEVLDYSKSLNEGFDDEELDEKDEEKRADAVDLDDLGERPTTIGESLENKFDELHMTGEPLKKKSWCRVQ